MKLKDNISKTKFCNFIKGNCEFHEVENNTLFTPSNQNNMLNPIENKLLHNLQPTILVTNLLLTL